MHLSVALSLRRVLLQFRMCLVCIGVLSYLVEECSSRSKIIQKSAPNGERVVVACD